jgi:hypothetical protein
MALTILGIADARWYLGPSLQAKLIQFTPAQSDYPTGGGYAITAEQCEFGNGHIYGAIQINQEYSPSSAPVYQVNLPSTSYGTSAGVSTTQFNVSAYWQTGTNATLLGEIAANTDLSSYPFWLLVLGY